MKQKINQFILNFINYMNDKGEKKLNYAILITYAILIILLIINNSCTMYVDNQDFHFEGKVEYPQLIESTK